jgi:hypothetical protein
MERRFKCLHIDAAKQTIVATDYADFRDLQVMIGGLISVACRMDNGDVLFVDDEGLLKRCDHFFRFDLYGPQPLAGNGVLVGPDVWDEEAGDEIGSDVSSSVDELAGHVTFLAADHVRSWAKGNSSEPASTITYVGNDGRMKTDILSTHGELFGVAPKGDK